MSLGYIADLKELDIGYQPLLLVQLTLIDGTQAFFCSHALNCAEGGFPYNGNNYMPRIINADDITAQALSQEGIDQPPNANIKLSDPDGFLFSNYELPIGFKGADCVISFIFWQVGTQNFSTDQLIKYIGKCSGGQSDSSILTIPTNSKINLSQTQMPTIHVQNTCDWSFPSTPAQRQDGANNDYSAFFECGYWPEGTGGNTVGNWTQQTTLASGVSAADTILHVVAAFIPTDGSGVSAFIIGQGQYAFIDHECVLVVDYDLSANLFYVQRGQQGTTSISHSSGATVGVPFTTCNYSRGNCIARLGNIADTTTSPDGNISVDKLGRPTARGSMIQYQPPAMTTSRGYISSKWEEIVNDQNEAKYGDSIPLCYGTTWVDPIVVVTQGDANFTYMEVVLCYGQINYIYDVIVNGERIPHAADSRMTQVPVETFGSTTGWWTAINDGRRNGFVNIAPPFSGKGDCYGSLAVLNIVVPVAVSTANSSPKVTVRLDGASVRVYTSPTAFTRTFSDNAIWVMKDILYWAGIVPADINIASAIAVAAKHDVQMAYKNILGAVVNTLPNERAGGAATQPYKRFAVSLTIRNRRSAADLIRGLRTATNTIILPNYSDGTFYFVFKSTLADQQPSQVLLNGHVATNAADGWISPNPDQTAGTGYPVYTFDETNIARKEGAGQDGSFPETTLKLTQTTIPQTTNTYSMQFQNAENKYNWDSATIADTEDISRVSVPITGNFNADGANTFDRVRRTAMLRLAEGMRGNPRFSFDGQAIGDTGGTILAYWESSFKGIHVKVGDLVSITYQKKNIQEWLFRISSVGVTMNGKRQKFTASYHNDIWYFLQYGQVDAPLFTTPWALANSRNPLVWSPNGEFPVSGDTVFSSTDGSFTLTQLYQSAKDNSIIASLAIGGSLPANQYSGHHPPFLDTQGSTAPTGGTVPGGFNMYLAICAKTVAGSSYLLSAPSYVSMIYIPAGTNTNTVSFSIPFWAASTPGYVAFAGRHVNRMSYQTDADATPSTITLTSYKEDTWGIPDIMFDHVEIDIRRIVYAGCWYGFVASTTSTTVTITTGGFATDQFSGYDLSLVAKNSPVSTMKIVNMRVASNTTDTFTLQSGSPDPSVYLAVGDAIVCRSLASYTTDGNGNGVVTDANWINALNPQEETIDVVANVVVASGVVTVTTATANSFVTGQQVSISDVLGVTPVNGISTITVITGSSFTLNGVVGSGTYTSGGTVVGLVPGLTNQVIGKIFRVFSGTGRGITMRIASNTSTAFTVDGPFPDPLDSTTRYWIEDSAPDATYTTASIVNRIPQAPLLQSMNVSNYAEQFLSVIAVAIDAGGIRSNEGLSPVRDIFLLGSFGAATDTIAPPLFGININTDYRGNFVLSGVGPIISPDIVANSYNTVEHATLQLFIWDMSTKAGPDWTLAAAIGDTDTTFTVDNATKVPYVGQLLNIEGELVSTLSVSGTTFSVARAAMASIATGHALETGVFALDTISTQLSFAPLFFTSANAAAASIYQQKIQAPNTVLMAAEFYATNDLGNGPVNHYCFAAVTPTGHPYGITTMPEGGLVAGVGGIADTFGVSGTLGIGSNQATPYQRDTITLPRQIIAQLRQPPVGGGVVVNLNAAGVLYQTINISEGATLQVVAGPLPPLQAGAVLTVDIVSVGTTFPGSDLGITVYG